MRSSVSIALFFLLSGFFLFSLLAALQRSRKALLIAIVCLAAVVNIIIFLTPVQFPDWWPYNDRETTTTITSTTISDVPIFGPHTTTTEVGR